MAFEYWPVLSIFGSMKKTIEELSAKIRQAQAQSEAELEDFRLNYLSKKGQIMPLFQHIKEAPKEDRKALGQQLNALKQQAEQKFHELKERVEEEKMAAAAQTDEDLTLPPVDRSMGSLHPITLVENEINELFKRIGFSLAYGPEMEDDYHNFTALNFPPNHPAREMQDTYFISEDKDTLLRTHTSSVQIRLMEKEEPPIRAIMPGRVYRNEAISARSHCLFHQVEGLYIDKDVSFKDLKQTLYYFAQEYFGSDTKIRFRPSYFPFTEPSAEVDVSCFICGGEGCRICKHSGWVEIGGAGMVDPNVLKAAHLDAEKYTGFAFGMGLERMAMLKFQLNDIRLFTENDQRFLAQFGPYLT